MLEMLTTSLGLTGRDDDNNNSDPSTMMILVQDHYEDPIEVMVRSPRRSKERLVVQDHQKILQRLWSKITTKREVMVHITTKSQEEVMVQDHQMKIQIEVIVQNHHHYHF